MSSLICTNCGMVGSVTDTTCRSCGTPVSQPGPYPPTSPIQESTSIPHVPVYGLPPASSLPYSARGSGIWRRGSVLVFRKSASLPDRCIKCNEPALGVRVDRKLYWHHPALALLIFAGLLVYAIVAMVVRKSAKVSLGFCQMHKTQRTRVLIAGWLTFALTLAVFCASLVEEDGNLALVGVALLIAAIVMGLLAGRFIRVKKIDDYCVWLKGIHPAYLEEFPPFSESLE